MITRSSIAKIMVLLAVSLLVIVSLSASTVSANDSISPIIGEDSAEPESCFDSNPIVYKTPWMIYGNDPTKMDILFETDLGVDNDSDHIKIHFDQSEVSCNRDYDQINIDNKSDHRLWTFSCSGFKTYSHYSFTIYYREYASSVKDYCWESHSGWFRKPTSVGAQELAFYGYGDTRAYDDTSNVEAVAKAIYQHHNSHNNDGAFIIHSGDIVPDGGDVANQWGVDRWQKSFWDVGTVDSMLVQLPIFTTIGNHDFSCDACSCDDDGFCTPLGCEDCKVGHINYDGSTHDYNHQAFY